MIGILLIVAASSIPLAPMPLADQPAEVRLIFGLVADNPMILASAFAPEVDGSIMDATLKEPVSRTRKGAAAVSQLGAGLEKMTGDVRSGECKAGEPGKLFCEFQVAKRNRHLQAFVDKNEAGIFSVVFVVTEKN